MTISSQTRKAGPFIGNGATTAFPFTFKVFAASDLLVTRADATGFESTLSIGTDYTVSLNSNQNTNPGGTVTTATAPASGNTLTLTSQVAQTQGVDLTNLGGFYPSVINTALDKITILIQQMQTYLTGALKLPLSASGVSATLPVPVAGKALKWNSTGTAIVNSTNSIDDAAASATAAAASATAAASSATSAASSATSATASATSATASATSATSSATSATASATSATASATSATSSATSAASSASSASSSASSASSSATSATGSATSATSSAASAATSASAAAATYDAFDDRYLGSFSSNPTLDNDGNALLTGALHWNTTASQLRVYTGSGWVGTVGAASGANPDITSWSGGPLAGFRNLLINGAMAFDQEFFGASTTFTDGAALKYAIDQWYGYCTGDNVTGLQVAGTAPNQFNYQFTGAASVTKIGFAQRMEAAATQHLAGTTATLSVDLANSLLTTVTWTAWRANTADTFGTLASPTRTQIGTGTFTVSSTLTRYNAQISIPTAATTGIEVEFSVGAQTSGTWTIGRAQLEQGGTATAFESTRPPALELLLCQRYWEKSYNQGAIPGTVTSVGVSFAITQAGSSGRCLIPITFAATKRVIPTLVAYNPVTGTAGQMRCSNTTNYSGLFESNFTSPNRTMFYNFPATLPPYEYSWMQWTANARL